MKNRNYPKSLRAAIHGGIATRNLGPAAIKVRPMFVGAQSERGQ
jgi:hypothetical protein